MIVKKLNAFKYIYPITAILCFVTYKSTVCDQTEAGREK